MNSLVVVFLGLIMVFVAMMMLGIFVLYLITYISDPKEGESWLKK